MFFLQIDIHNQQQQKCKKLPIQFKARLLLRKKETILQLIINRENGIELNSLTFSIIMNLMFENKNELKIQLKRTPLVLFLK